MPQLSDIHLPNINMPQMPDIHMPQMPNMPQMPQIPQVPQVPHMHIDIPEVPRINMPSFPHISMPQFPSMPRFPSMPHISFPQFPHISFPHISLPRPHLPTVHAPSMTSPAVSMPAVVPGTSSITTFGDRMVYLLRFSLVFMAAVLFSLSFGIYMIDAMGAWPRPRQLVGVKNDDPFNGPSPRRERFVPPHPDLMSRLLT